MAKIKKALGRKFLLAVLNVALIAANRKWGLGLTPQDLLCISGPIAAFILGESGVDAAHAWGGQAAASGSSST